MGLSAKTLYPYSPDLRGTEAYGGRGTIKGGKMGERGHSFSH